MTAKTKKIIRIAAFSLGGVVGVLLLLSVAVALFVGSEWGQKKLKDFALDKLQTTLKTKVQLDSVSIGILNPSLEIYGFRIDDLAGEKLLVADTLKAKFDVWGLLSNRLEVDGASARGVNVNVYKVRSDSAANYQFLVDNVSSNKPKSDGGKKLDVKIETVKLENATVSYQVRDSTHLNAKAHIDWASANVADTTLKVEKLSASYNDYVASVENLEADWTKKKANIEDLAFSYRGMSVAVGEVSGCYISQELELKDVKFAQQGKSASLASLSLHTDGDMKHLKVTELRYKTDNGKPRRNKVNPRRGAFDAGHLDLVVNGDFKVLHLAPDSVSIVAQHVDLADKVAGFFVDPVTFSATTNMQTATVKNLHVVSHSTVVDIPSVRISLPVKGQKFRFDGAHVSAKTILKDISVPFAPPLKNFTTPLTLTTLFSGEANKMWFNNVVVKTADNSLCINAKGEINDFNKKLNGGRKVHVLFHVTNMRSTDATKMKIIHHFIEEKKSLSGIMHAMGAIGYKGSLEVGHHYQTFRGTLSTQLGSVTTDFTMHSDTKWLEGKAHTQNFHVGKLVKKEGLGTVALSAEFKFDISSKKSAAQLGRKHGPLPMGSATGHVEKIDYRVETKVLGIKVGKDLTFKNVDCKLDCDGHKANGLIEMKHSHVDVSVDFSFTDTKFSKENLKYTPHIKIHDINPFKKKD
ncbi:MAG: hypothetical protein MJZ63_02450 [Muribaculaceae bacterium]|nr:hypothetical protein [Muribaculaceae bacterium]